MADNEVHGRPLTQVGFLRQLLQPEPQREPETRPSPQRQLQELGPPVPVRVCAPRQRASSHSSWSVRWPCLLQVVFQPQLLQAEEPQSQQSLQLRVRIRWKGTKTTSDTQLSPFTFTTLSHLWCYMSAAEDKKGLPKTFRDILNWRGREKCYCILYIFHSFLVCVFLFYSRFNTLKCTALRSKCLLSGLVCEDVGLYWVKGQNVSHHRPGSSSFIDVLHLKNASRV